MFVQLLILCAGLILILIGANYLVEGSSVIARKAGISEFVIGLTIVGIGTSAPEMVVSFLSAIKGNADMAVGNVVGSNIFNTMLILGVTALISPLVITRTNLKRDIPMNIIATVLLIAIGMRRTVTGHGEDVLGRAGGALFLLIFAYYMYLSFTKDTPVSSEDENGHPKKISAGLSVIMLLGGLAGLIFGGQLFVDSASSLSKMFGVSDAFIAITVMAGGTSLPELATCIVAALKGKGQLALGNILGSNISNILLILGGSALINPLSFSGLSLVDLGAVLLCSVFILASAYLFKKNMLDRTEAVILLLMEAGYMAWLIYTI